MKIYLLRHGNTFAENEVPKQIGCNTDLQLTNVGQDQISRAAKYFEGNKISFDCVYSGPLKRHEESAKIIGYPYEKTDLLNEIDYGLWENIAIEEIKDKWPEEYKNWSKKGIWPHNIFTTPENTYKERLKNLLNDTVASANHDNIMLITSQGTIRFFLQLSPSWNKIKKNEQVENYKVKPGNFCVIESVDINNIIIKEWNKSPKIS